jgi:vacuolar-type H+-ATPase subunit E/Vma4
MNLAETIRNMNKPLQEEVEEAPAALNEENEVKVEEEEEIELTAEELEAVVESDDLDDLQELQVGGGATGASKVAYPTDGKAKVSGKSSHEGAAGDQAVINPVDGDTEETDSENNTKPTGDMSAKNKASVAMKGSSMKEHLTIMFDGEELSEDFKEKAGTIFEAAISERVSSITEELESQFNTALTEAIEETEASAKESIEKLSNQLDEYLNYVTEQWMEENQIAVEAGLKTKITEQFIEGLRELFVDNYMDIPEDKVDVVEGMANKVDELENELNGAVSANIELSNEINEMKVNSMIEDACQNLTESEADKLKALAEGIEYDSDESFTKKLDIIKENYFSDETVEVKTSGLLEESFEGEEESAPVVGPMAHYVSAISRNVKKK